MKFVRNTLSLSFNTKKHEGSPVLSPDGKTMYFHRYDGEETSQNIYVTSLQDDGSWGESKKLDEPINNSYSNEILEVGADGTLYLRGTYSEDGFDDAEGISISFPTTKGWSPPELLEFEKTPEWSFLTYISLSSDDKNMILSIGDGETSSLYHSYFTSSNRWSFPVLLSENVNNDKRQESPFISKDNSMMYFASDGHGGFGGMDIFCSKRLDDSWLNWSEPINLGDTVNSADWESSFCISPRNNSAFMLTWENTMGEGDIGHFFVHPIFPPARGYVFNKKDSSAISASVSYFFNEKEKTTKSDSLTGFFEVPIKEGDSVLVSCQSIGYVTFYDTLIYDKLIKEDDYIKVDDIYLTPISVGTIILLKNVTFESGKAELKATSIRDLELLLSTLRNNPTMKIEVSGHTDNVGDPKKNILLSLKRANSVVNYLIDNGIGEDRLIAKGYGSDKPVDKDNPHSNRRVEFVILKN